MENIQGAKEVSYFHAPVSSNWTPVFDIWPMGEEQFFLKQNIRTVAGGGERGEAHVDLRIQEACATA